MGMPIFFRLWLTIIIAITVVSVSLSLAYYKFDRDVWEKNVEETVLQQFATIEQYFNYGLKEPVAQNLDLLRANPLLDQYLTASQINKNYDRRAVERLFVEVLRSDDRYLDIAYVSAFGEEAIKVSRDGVPGALSDLRESRLFRELSGGPPGRLRGSTIFTTPENEIAIRLGVDKIDADIGLFGGAILLTYSLNDFVDYLRSVKILGKTPIWIFLKDGTVLSSPSDESARLDPRGYLQDSLIANAVVNRVDEGFFVCQDFRVVGTESQLRVVVSIPDSLLFASYLPLVRFLGMLLLLALFVSSLLAGYLARLLSHPITELAATASNIAKDGFLSKVQIKSSGEIRLLIESFNQMIDDLRRTTVSRNALQKEMDERERAEQAQAESEARLTKLIEDVKVIPWEADAATNQFTYVGPYAQELLGYPVEAWYGDDFWARAIHADDCAPADTYCRQTAKIKDDFELEYRMVRQDGKEIWVKDIVHVIREPGGAARLRGVLMDITEHKKLEQQLMQAQKMDAIGRLAGGIAHDFNNILTVIGGYGREVLRNLPEDSRDFQDMQEIMIAQKRAAELVKQLLAFGRRQIVTPEVTDLNQLIEATANMLRRLIGSDICLETKLQEDLGRVRIDPGQLEQVLANLTVNARDAMEGGGSLIIETVNVSLSEEGSQETDFALPGEYVSISIKDTGSGMSPEVQKNIFEPFYTTKAQGKGTGLGLAMCYGIIKRHDGYITVVSEDGKGTTFRILLPRVYARAEEKQEKTVPVSLPKKGGETILLVEDEERVLALAARYLEECGYQVLHAANGRDALETASSHASIDLLLTDVVMPGMSGRELAKRIRSRLKNIKVLFISGYHEELIGKDEHFLSKPFSEEDLVVKVRAVLDAAQSLRS